MLPAFIDYPKHIRALIDAARTTVSPSVAVQRYLQLNGRSLKIGGDSIVHTHSLQNQDRIFLVSVGGAALPMARSTAQILGRRLTRGIVIIPPGIVSDPETTAGYPNLELYPAGCHRAGILMADENSLAATAMVRQLLQGVKPHDLVLILLSGDAAPLLTQPQIPLATWHLLRRALPAADDQPWLTVARQLDAAKNGGLARWAEPATCVTLALNSRMDDASHLLGGGPTVAKPNTLAEAVAMLSQHQVGTKLEANAWRQVVQALHQARQQPTRPSPRGHYLVIGDGEQAATAALVKAAQLGFSPQVLTTHLRAEARQTGRIVAALARDARSNTCLILGGKTAVSSAEKDKARNQTLALAAALALDGQKKRVVAALDSSGRDGTSTVAGAVISGATAEAGRTRQLDPTHHLQQHDSAAFFAQLDQRQTTHPPTQLSLAPSAIGVNDLIFILAYAS